MRLSPFFLLAAVYAGGVYAAPPTLTDSSIGVSDVSYSSVPSTSKILDAITKLQNDVTQLKSNVSNQAVVINDLKARQVKLETLASTPVTSSAQAILGGNNLVTQSKPHETSTTTVGEKTAYESARALLNNGDNDQAIAAFQSIIKTYPNGAFADNSEYWMGEALLKKGDKTAAMQAFDRIVRQYPGSPKIPDALLKLGMTQTVIGNKVKAKEYFDYLIAAYPGTPSASIAFTKRTAL